MFLRVTQIRRKYYPIIMKNQKYLYFSTDICCLYFGENRKSLNIQNGWSEFAQYANFCKNFQIFPPIWKQNIFLKSAWPSDSKII